MTMYLTICVVKTTKPLEKDLLYVDVGNGLTLADLKAVIQSDIKVRPEHQHLYFNNVPLRDDEATLSSLGVVNGEVLALHVREPTGASNSSSGAGSSSIASSSGTARELAGTAVPADPQTSTDYETLRLHILGDPRLVANVQRQEPALASVLHESAGFARVMGSIAQQRLARMHAHEARIAQLNADPFDPEAQRQIETMIREQAVHENLQAAMEHMPEAFGRVSMLYIHVKVNGVPIKAFVDSGAQVTVMSPRCAERCNVTWLIDRRYGGVAKGVGTAKIIGRVHTAQMQIGEVFLPSSCTVMEGKGIDLLLGLDMLKRHQACIDLKEMVLRIADQAVPFLTDKDIPQDFEDEMFGSEPVVKGSEGAEIGARTGAVTHQAQSSASGPPPGPPPSMSAPQSSDPTTFTTPSAGTTAPYAASAGLSGQSGNQTLTLPTTYSEAQIAQITDLGFSRAEAVQALEASGGNVEMAIGLLL
ncbi:DNA damage-inducible protein 1 [Ascosphaera acerosa]|nr:DNA damage-inducible protein 1 [Ascosphaera acerosa]